MAYSARVEIIQGSQNIESNSTQVTYRGYVAKTSGSGVWSGYQTSVSISYTGGTKTVYVSSYDFRNYTELKIFDFTVTTPHNADGTMSVSCSFTWNADNPYLGSISGSNNKTLSTIPRASSFGEVTGNTLGSSMTINISRHSNSFTHSLWYSFGSKTWQAIGSSISTSKTFTLPISLCSEITSSTSGTITLILRTYNGSTKIGNDVYKTLTVYVPESVAPSISNISVSEGTSGLANQFACYVKNKSTLNVSITASGSQGSTISSYSTSILGNSYSGSSFKSYGLSSSGTVTIKTTVKDTRGRTASSSMNVTVVDYENPTISKFTAQRANSDGTINDNGAYIKFAFNYKIYPVNNKNTKSVKIQYLNDSDWIDIYTPTTSLYEYDGVITTDTQFSDDNSWQFRLVVSDYFSSPSARVQVSTGFELLNINANGKTFAVGKVSEKDDTMEVALKTEFLQSVIIPNAIKANSNVPLAGSGLNDGEAEIGATDQLHNYPTFIGSVTTAQTWYNLISCRHRNGNGDGNNYGMAIWSKLTTLGDLKWRQQTNGTWQPAKTLLDDSNYGNFVEFNNIKNKPQFYPSGIIDSDYTGSDKANYWFKVCTMNIRSRYADAVAVIDFHNYQVSSNIGVYGTIYAKVKQQPAMGQAPYWTCVLSSDSNLGTSNLALQLVSNTSTLTSVELWMRLPRTYERVRCKLNFSTGEVSMSSDTTLKVSLGTGTTTNAVRPHVTGDTLNYVSAIWAINGNEHVLQTNTTNTLWLNYRKPSGSGASVDWRFGDGSSGGYGKITCLSLTQNSDRKLKEDFKLISKAKEFILGLTPYDYKFKDGHRRHMGFIAQDVSDLCKEIEIGDMAVYQANSINVDGKPDAYFDENADDEDLRWNLTYSEFIAPMVQVIQDQNEEIESLKETVSILKEQVQQLLNNNSK